MTVYTYTASELLEAKHAIREAVDDIDLAQLAYDCIQHRLMWKRREQNATKVIMLQHDHKPIPDRDHDWDCWVDGDEEAGTQTGRTAADALRALADRLEGECHD